MGIASPIWGVLGDRYGRKPMLLRSMVGGALTVGLMYFARNPTDLLVLRFLQGATSGTVAAATSLVAAETPRNRVAWALGVVTSAVALGGAIGPVVGGLAAAVFGLRLVFLGGGILLMISLIPVMVIVRESPRIRQRGARVRNPRAHRPATRLETRPRGAARLPGPDQRVQLGDAAARGPPPAGDDDERRGRGDRRRLRAGGTGQQRRGCLLHQRDQAVRLCAHGRRRGAMVAVAVLLIGFSPWAAVVVIGIGLNGLFSGVVIPATASMIGLETPPVAQSTVFGMNASSIAFGFCVGPLIGGGVAATAGVPIALVVIAAIALALAALLAARAREPAR